MEIDFPPFRRINIMLYIWAKEIYTCSAMCSEHEYVESETVRDFLWPNVQFSLDR